ncbi:MAG: IS4 family transposase, partial [Deltaproteobacteria bacterium]
TTAKVADITVAKLLRLPAFSIVVMDRAYVDFAWLHKLNHKKVFFVTRLKRGINYRVVKRRKVIKTKGLTSDQTILLTGTKAKDCPIQLRRVGYRDADTGQHYVFLTNIFHLSAKTIADIYRERWQVETFFKWIKQNLKIKSFLGTSKDAVMTQIWVAIITLLLLAYYKFRAKLGHSLSQILKLLQLNLFSRRNVWQLFDPGPTKHMLPNCDQFSLNFNNLQPDSSVVYHTQDTVDLLRFQVRVLLRSQVVDTAGQFHNPLLGAYGDSGNVHSRIVSKRIPHPVRNASIWHFIGSERL